MAACKRLIGAPRGLEVVCVATKISKRQQSVGVIGRQFQRCLVQADRVAKPPGVACFRGQCEQALRPRRNRRRCAAQGFQQCRRQFARRWQPHGRLECPDHLLRARTHFAVCHAGVQTHRCQQTLRLRDLCWTDLIRWRLRHLLRRLLLRLPLLPLPPPPSAAPAAAPPPPPPSAVPTAALLPPPPSAAPASAPLPPPPSAAPTSAPLPPPPSAAPTAAPLPPPPSAAPTSAPLRPPPSAAPTSAPLPPPPSAAPTSVPLPPQPSAAPLRFRAGLACGLIRRPRSDHRFIGNWSRRSLASNARSHSNPIMSPLTAK